jgi:hypothetical protein
MPCETGYASKNNLVAVTVRRNWIKAGWHPPIG